MAGTDPEVTSSDDKSIEDDREWFRRQLLEFSSSSTAELAAAMKRLDAIIGKSHWLSVGTYKESLIRRLLRQRVPRDYEVSTGFVMSSLEDKRLISRQIDVLIWNAARFAPFFRDGDFVIVPPEACRAAIEVKGVANTKHLREGLANLESLTPFCYQFGSDNAFQRALFAFEPGEDFRFPETALRVLKRHYEKKQPFRLDDRCDRTGGSLGRGWMKYWISCIAVMKGGSLAVDRYSNGPSHGVFYNSYRTQKPDMDDAYGFLERMILFELLVKRSGHSVMWDLPGTTSLMFALPTERDPNCGGLVIPDSAANRKHIRDVVPDLVQTPLLGESRQKKSRTSN